MELSGDGRRVEGGVRREEGGGGRGRQGKEKEED